MSETDGFEEAVPWPEIPDTTYPTVSREGARILASRTRFFQNTWKGNYSALSSEFLTLAEVPEELVTSYLTLANRHGLANPIRLVTYAFLRSLKWLKERVPAARAGGWRIHVPLTAVNQGINNPSSATWLQTTNTELMFWIQVSTSAEPLKMFTPPLPPGAVITAATARVRGFGHSALPANRPQLALYDQQAHVASQVATVTDPSANFTVYDTAHDIVLPLNLQVSQFSTYWLRVTGESGSGSESNGFVLYQIYLTVQGLGI